MLNNRTTKLLRKLLDERGVKWGETFSYENDIVIWWESPIFGTVHAMDNDDGETLFMACLNHSNLTPEQAIAATLGNGTLMASNEMPLLPCPFCGDETHMRRVDFPDGDAEYVFDCACGRKIFETASKAKAIAAWNTRAELERG